jgi:hypothetical protein
LSRRVFYGEPEVHFAGKRYERVAKLAVGREGSPLGGSGRSTGDCRAPYLAAAAIWYGGATAGRTGAM